MNTLSRRSVLKAIGIGTAATTAVGGIAAAKDKKEKPEPAEPTIEPEYLTNWSTVWSPQTINLGGTSILQSRWGVATPSIPAYHRFDVVVDASRVEKPRLVATDFTASDIKKNWEYTSYDQRINGPAYHFLAKKWIYAPFGSDLYLDSKIKPTYRGTVEAQSGAYYDPVTNIAAAWSRGYLDAN